MENDETYLRNLVLESAVEYYKAAHARPGAPYVPGNRIQYAGRVFDKDEIVALIDSALDFWLTHGRYVDKFETDLSKFLGVKHCSITNSGSSANLLAFMALTSPELGDRRIRRGDEVITVAASFPTTVSPLIQYGAVPVFVDITLPTYNIDCDQMKSAVSDKTRAVIIAHTMGNPFNLNVVKAFCDRYNLWLIEDNCDALGSRYLFNGDWRYTGAVGHMGTSSFYPPHHLTMGEGGAVYTSDPRLRRLVESFRDWGRDCRCPSGCDDTCHNRFGHQFGELPFGYDHKYVYSHFGYNLKATDMQAAVGCAQLRKLSWFIEARKRNWQHLRDALEDLKDYFVLPEATNDSDPSWFGFLLTVKDKAGFTRDQIVNYLETHGIQTRMLFAGNLLKQPCFDEMRRLGKGFRVVGDLKNTNIAMNHSFWLGVYPGISEEHVNYMVNAIKNFIAKLA
ncbi:MAG: lipopolysaccharide biosynthesis protein RfbH [Peptococcaceae bacterium]|jgi:CDP-6-deoxy-D-xylo-4-hexulose-3-dehydrase|nr:lipopolysaccharide biosynthesis protein RfbH [Peptococcaceae bacterium]